MKYVIIITVLFSLFLLGCDEGEEWVAKCRHNAIYCALIVGEHYPTRLAYGRSIKEKNKFHVQAQAKINGKWVWLARYKDT